jgi:hypothetical protein
MSQARRSLASLGPHLARKTVDKPSTKPAEPADKRAPKDSRVQVLVRLAAKERKALRGIALELDSTVQALIEQAVHDLIARHSK